MNNSTCEGGACGAATGPSPLLVLPVVLSVLWVLFDLFYVSFILRLLVNRLVNLFLKDSGVHIGAVRISLLTGRVLFKDAHYYCRDYSIRITDGYAVLRWWRRRSQSACSRCASCGGDDGSVQKSLALVFFQLNGFELHWYNRSDVYDSWGKPKTDNGADSDSDSEESGLWTFWKEMQPFLQFSFRKGRLVFGNHLVERSLVVYFDKAEAHYSTTKASTPYDELMHLVEWHGVNVRMVLEPSSGYEGPIDEGPPVQSEGMEDAYPVCKTDTADCTYSLDSPGLVPLGERRGPKFAFDVVLGSNSVINYGCYANRQRTQLQKFFFPNDHTERPVTEYPQPGEKRIYTSFDVSVRLSCPAVFNLLFKDKEVQQHISLELGGDSFVEINQPWTTDDDGYTSVVSGRLGEVKASTSLEYHPLGRAKNIEFKTSLHFPRVWNSTQTWDMRFDASHAQANILFAYIDFVNAFLDDWLGEEPSDLLHFYPIDWKVAINLYQYEIFLFTNRYNWVDVDGTENTRLAFCGTTGQITFAFPFTEFLPLEQKIGFTANGQNLVVRHYSPPSCSTRESLFTLSSTNKHRWRVLEFREQQEGKQQQLQGGKQRHPGDNSTPQSASSSPSVRSKMGVSVLTLDSDKDRSKESLSGVTPKFGRPSATKFWVGDGASMSVSQEEQAQPADIPDTQPEELADHEFFPMGYRGETKYENGWLDIACGPSISISINYHSHSHDPRTGKDRRWVPNVMNVDIDAPTVVLRVFGCLARDLLALKENYPGEYINFTTFNSNVPFHSPPSEKDPNPLLADIPPSCPPDLPDIPPSCPPDLPDEPKGRFVDVIVDFKLHNITAEFPNHLPEGYPRDFPLPTACTSLFSVCVAYVGHETTVQLLIEPFTVQVASVSIPPAGGDPTYELGHMACTGINFNCHGFTEFMCQERVEYAWLMQLLVGRITGAISTEQLLQAADWFHTAFIHTASYGDGFIEAPDAELIEPKVEPLSEKIKYLLFNLSILEADVHLLEGDLITRLQSPGFDLGFCSLHSNAETLGLSLQLQGLTATSYTPSSTMSDLGCLLECGLLDIGNIQGDLNLREFKECVPQRQLEFLRKADTKTRRLWFLWHEEEEEEGDRFVLRDEFRCGCCGGCVFLDGCIERQPQRVKLDSVVYTREVSHSEPTKVEDGAGTFACSLGLQTLKQALSTLGVKELECVLHIHRGLLDHYEQKYAMPVAASGSADTPSSHTQHLLESSEFSRPLSVISDSSFKSARSSLTLDESDEDQFLSMENISEAGLYGLPAALSLGSGRKPRHRKKASALSSELKAMAVNATGRRETETVDALLSTDTLAPYRDLVATQAYRPTLLYVPLRKRKQPDVKVKTEAESLQPPLKYPKPFDRAIPQAEIHPASQPFGSQLSEAVPQLLPRHHTETCDALRLRVPVLLPFSHGFVPTVVQKGLSKSMERRRRRGVYGGLGEGGSGPDERKLAKVSLSIVVNGSLTLTVSPLLLGFVERVTQNVGDFFEHRSASAILDVLSNDSNSTVQSHISKLLKEKSFNPLPADSQPPLLHLTVSMAPTSFAAIQLLQAPQSSLVVPPFARQTHPSSLKHIVPHSSLVTLYLSGLNCKALLVIASELQQPTQDGNNTKNRSNLPPHQEATSVDELDPSRPKPRTLLNSFKVSANVRCPVFQIAVCALVPVSGEDGVSQDTLPGLSAAQSQLSFQLSAPVSMGDGGKKDMKEVTVHNLLELGVRDASVMCVAKIIHSEISEEAILTWTNVQGYHISDPTSRVKTDDFETKSNKVVVKASLPSLWSQLAAPHTGIPNCSTGGLDILTLSEAIDAWKPGVEGLIDSVKLVLKGKTAREKNIILTLLSNAAMCALCRKPSNPLHCEVSATLRRTVVYNCIHHLWRTLPTYSERMLSSLPVEGFCDKEIVATALALASRLFSIQEAALIQRKRLKSRMEPSEPIVCPTCGPRRPKSPDRRSDTNSILTVGYVSISPSPSELALPNMVFSTGQGLEAVDYNALFNKVRFDSIVVIRESLLPFFVVAGIAVDPQLRVLCHNSAEYFADFVVELREATIFVAESAHSESTQPAFTVQYSSNPVLLAEQFVVNGCLKYSSESSLERSPHLSLLAKNSIAAEGLQQATTSKLNISSKCCVSLENVATSVTIPLLRLGRHMIETGKLRSSWRNKFRREMPESQVIVKAEAAVPLPRTVWPSEEHTIINVDTPDFEGTPARSTPLNIWEFSQSLVLQLSHLEEENVSQLPESLQKAGPVGGSGEDGNRGEGEVLPPQSASSKSTPSSKPIKITTYPHSPRYPRVSIVSPPAAGKSPDSKTPFLAVPTPHIPSYSNGTGTHAKQSHARHKRRPSSTSNSSTTTGEEVAIHIEDTDDPRLPDGVFLMSPDEQAAALDTYGGDIEDTTDSQHIVSSDNEVVSSSPNHSSFIDPSILGRSDLSTLGFVMASGIGDHTYPLVKSLQLTETELLFTVFGLLKINRISFDLQVETTRASLELGGISASVDARKATTTSSKPTSRTSSLPRVPSGSATQESASQTQDKSELLPTYLSIAATLKKSRLRVKDRGLPDSDLAHFSAFPIYCSLGICNSSLQQVPTYRCLLKLSGVELDVKQSPVRMHKRFQHLMPAFTKIYDDIFAPNPGGAIDPGIFQQSTNPSTPMVSMAEVKMPAKLPQGFVHLSLGKATMLMAPLPSLSVTYSLSLVSAQVETSHHISFSLGVGDQALRFSPKEQYKDELSLRHLSLPTVSLNGEVKSGRHNKLPRVTVEMVVKQVNIDLTTDVLNQLLILQNSFIKELNDLVQLFINIGESIPHKDRLTNIRQETIQESGTELISFLESCKLSLSGFCITISTPLSTALRFSTGKIDMLVTNTSSQLLHGPNSFARSQLSLSGKVDIDISLALGYLQDLKADVVDDFCELAYFRTRIAIRNTQQNVRQTTIPGEEEQGKEAAVLVDTFVISILSPHLYVQSTAIEQAILFWLNCKSVYSYWQNERKQLNAEVQAATEAIIEKIHRPTQLQTPSIDFSKPRLVQITVSDVGACMPLMPVPTTPHSAQKAFPALVITIKEMQLLVNLSHKVASTGNFSTFCMRFAEQFYLRHKTWTLDPKRHKFTNCGSVNHGTFRLCIATKKSYSETDPSVVLGEKLLWAFQWDMSGIDVNANTDIGRHMSTLVRTMTTIGTDLEGKTERMKKVKSGTSLPTMKPQPLRSTRRTVSVPRAGHHHHQRTTSLLVGRPPAVEEEYKEALEQDLARQTRKLQKLRYSGATGDSLKSEEETLRKVEQELARTVHKMFRRPRGISFHQLNQIFSPRPMSTGKPLLPASEEKGLERRGSMKKRLSTVSRVVRRQLFSMSSETTGPTIAEEEPLGSAQGDGIKDLPSPLSINPRTKTGTGPVSTHRRFKSDITGMLQSEERVASRSPVPEEDSSPPSSTPTPTLMEDTIFSSSEPVPHSRSTLLKSVSTPTASVSHELEEEEEEEGRFSLPSIDVEVNVTINVDYGIIVLRTEESTDRRGSAPLGKPYSPHVRRLHPTMSESPFSSSPRFPHDRSKHPPSAIDSVLLVPALKVKVHYQSIVGAIPPWAPTTQVPRELSPHCSPIPPTKFVPQVKAPSATPTRDMETNLSDLQPEMQTKRGVLSISAVVASLPEDVELTPSLLEFIEQVARPTLAATEVTSSSSESDTPADIDSGLEGPTQPHQQPTSDPWPISFPVDVTLTFQIQPSTVHLSCQPLSRVQCMIQSPDVNFVISFSLFTKQQLENSFSADSSCPPTQDAIVPFNNLYITGCLTTFVLQLLSPQVTSGLKQYSTTPKIENKEALSLTLGQALIHLSRKTVLAPYMMSQGPQGKGTGNVDDYSMQNKPQVSVMTNIASLVLGYDMRRLNDVTAFRRYWYRTSLVEALFIGSKKKPSEDTPSVGLTPSAPPTSKEDSLTELSAIAEMDDSISAAIAVAATVDDFRVSANVAQVMGNTNLLVTHLKCQAHADISHNELVMFNLDGRMMKGEVDARGGVIAGSILMEDVQAHVTTDSQQGSIPVHKGTASIQLVEGRVDYMSSCIILGRATCVNAQISDSWEGLQLGELKMEEEGRPPSASIHILADFTWENLQLAIHRSTTKSMFNIVQKMHEFIMQQKRRSERTISIMLPAGSAASKALAAYREEQKRAEEEKKGTVATRNHWLWAIRVGSVDLMRTLGIHTPDDQFHDVCLGGKITIAGQNVCMVCFHGTSFRETEWAVFNIDLINASFSTQAIPGLGAAYMMESQAEEGFAGPTHRKRIRTCQQICTLRLGTDKSRSAELATVYRVSAGRSRVPPITGTNINDWLAYACIDYHLHPDNYQSSTAKLSALVKFSKKLNVQPVLLVPAFTVDLINDHFWPLFTNGQQSLGKESHDPTPDELPLVECSLHSKFSEGISVTTTVDHYLFLHDLVKGYIEYLERHKAVGSPEPATEPEEPQKCTDPSSRQFVCVCWELDPHLLLLTTVSGQFNPHINWLLEKLGFKHARTTLPKSIQRGAMDPLDMVIANVLELLVKLTATKKLQMSAASPATID